MKERGETKKVLSLYLLPASPGNTAVNSLLAGPLQPALTYIPPCCSPPLLDLLLRLSVTACIHFKTPLLLFMATKAFSPSTSQPYFSPHQRRLVCFLALPSVPLWPDYRFTRSRVFPAAAPPVVKCTSRTPWQLHSCCPFSVRWPITSCASASSRFACACSFALHKPPQELCFHPKEVGSDSLDWFLVGKIPRYGNNKLLVEPFTYPCYFFLLETTLRTYSGHADGRFHRLKWPTAWVVVSAVANKCD